MKKPHPRTYKTAKKAAWDAFSIFIRFKYAKEIASIFKDYWSIDFCKAKSGKWYCIDMAIGYDSWHPECQFKLERG